MLPEVFGECPDRVRVATLTGKEQPANVQVMEQGDVIVAPPRCRLVDPDSRYIAEVPKGPKLITSALGFRPSRSRAVSSVFGLV